MKSTEKILRNLIREELGSLFEADEDKPSNSAGLSDQQKKKLKALASSPPTGLNSFATSMKNLGSILGDIDEKSANLNADQIKKYFEQIMVIVDSMMSEEKTSSTETGKIKKAVGG